METWDDSNNVSPADIPGAVFNLLFPEVALCCCDVRYKDPIRLRIGDNDFRR